MRYLTLLLIMMLSAASFAQTTISGVVRDNERNAVEAALITAFSTSDSTIVGYGLSDDAGRYSVEIAEATDIPLEIIRKDVAAIYYRKYIKQVVARKREQTERRGVIYPQRKRFSKYKVVCILRTIALVGALIFGIVVLCFALYNY